jgi:hypothetical protein
LALSDSTKSFRQFGCAEHIGDPFDIVSHRGDADFYLRTRQATQQAWMSEDPILIVANGCSTVPRRSFIASGVTRSCIRFKASSFKWRSKPRLGAWVQRDFSEQAPQSLDEALYIV